MNLSAYPPKLFLGSAFIEEARKPGRYSTLYTSLYEDPRRIPYTCNTGTGFSETIRWSNASHGLRSGHKLCPMGRHCHPGHSSLSSIRLESRVHGACHPAPSLPILTLCQRDTSCSQTAIAGERNAPTVQRGPHRPLGTASLRPAVAPCPCGHHLQPAGLHLFPILSMVYGQVQSSSSSVTVVNPSGNRPQGYIRKTWAVNVVLYSTCSRHSTVAGPLLCSGCRRLCSTM